MSNRSKKKVQKPWSSLGLGMLNTLVCGGIIILMILFPNDSATWWVYLILGLFLLIGLWNLCTTVTWEVKIQNNYIQFRNSLGRTQNISFKDVEKIKVFLKVMVKRDGIQIKDILSEKKTFYDSVERIKMGSYLEQTRVAQITLYLTDGKKIFSITPDYRGFDDFMEKLKQENVKFETVGFESTESFQE